MSRLVSRAGWLALVGVTTIGLLGGLVLHPQLNLDATIVPVFLVYGVVGAVITLRRPDTALGWVFQLVGALTATSVLASGYAERTVPGRGAPAPRPDFVPVFSTVRIEGPLVLALGFLGGYWMVILSLSTTVTLLLFPHPPATRAWRAVLVVAAVAVSTMAFIGATAQYVGLNGEMSVLAPNPLWVGIPWDVWHIGSPVFDVAIGVVVACGLARALAMVRDYRRSTGIERQQLRWLAWAVALFFPLNLVSGTSGDSYPVLGTLLSDVALALIPVSCAVAILRYRLYDIGRLISRTTSYLIVTACVVAVYAVVVTSATTLLPDRSSTWAVAGATLAAAALVRPLLSRVQAAVDRRFNRERIDAQRAVDEYGARLADQVDPEVTARELLSVADHTWSPSTVRLWRAT